MQEIWKPIDKTDGFNEVSNFGRIRSYRNRGTRLITPVILSGCICKDTGYVLVSIKINNKFKSKRIHTLVLEAFIGPRPPNMEACHNNGIKTDNRLDNLRWDTALNNTKDKIKHGTGSNIHERAVIKIRQLYDTGKFEIKELSCIFNIPKPTISGIVNGYSWKYTEGPVRGLRVKKKKDKENKIIDAYHKTDISVRELAKLCKLSASTVRSCLNKYNLKPKGPGVGKHERKPR